MKNSKGDFINFIVCADMVDFETQTLTQKSYRTRKAANNYGLKLVKKYGHCTITKCVNGVPKETEFY